MLHSFVLDAARHLGPCGRLKEFGLQCLQRGCLLQRECRRQKELGRRCSGSRARRGRPIGEEKLSRTAQAVTPDLGADLLVGALLSR